MIFGFKIIAGIPEDLTYKILGNIGMKIERIKNPLGDILEKGSMYAQY